MPPGSRCDSAPYASTAPFGQRGVRSACANGARRDATMNGTIRCLIRRDTYRDSVELMRVATALEQRSGVARAALLMGTPPNRELLSQAGLLVGDAEAARPNDLVVVIQAADDASIESALAEAESLLADHGTAPSAATGETPLQNISDALVTAPPA